MKIGSLFDGIAGFPLVAQRHGMTPVWASEIEPFPIEVTKVRFPGMLHLGDITKVKGTEIEPVDVITFGSPCQDLSVAGKRAGLEGERSGLFMEAIRIIRGMRGVTLGAYPRFAVWENVPGAFSSKGGADFRAVLEELTQTEIPMPASGKWANAGMVRSGCVEVAWRVLDAQFWGVPQRRRRIYLVADFGGQCAGKILFEREGVRWHTAEGRSAGQGTAGSIESGVITAGFKQGNSATARSIGYEVEKSPTLTSGQSGTNLVPAVVCRKPIPIIDKATRYKGGGDTRKNDGSGNGLGIGKPGDPSPTLTAGDRHAVAYPVGPARSLTARNDGSPCVDRVPETIYALDRAAFNQGANAQYAPQIDADGKTQTVIARGPNAVGVPNKTGYKVRRLTPLECERLQGYPDNWTNIPGASDTARYKALGNSIAIPCADFVLGGIAEELAKGEPQCS